MFMTAIACHSHPRKTLLDAKRECTPTDDGTPMPVDGSEEKITFASVHDCFWTHAATVDAMNRVLREQFVELYSRPILQDLAKELREMYPDFKIPVIVRRALQRERHFVRGRRGNCMKNCWWIRTSRHGQMMMQKGNKWSRAGYHLSSRIRLRGANSI